jgi:hypothetical protein
MTASIVPWGRAPRPGEWISLTPLASAIAVARVQRSRVLACASRCPKGKRPHPVMSSEVPSTSQASKPSLVARSHRDTAAIAIMNLE